MAAAGKASGSATTFTLDSGFGDFLKRLDPKPSTTIRFFERNDYYTVHHEDAYFVAKDYYKTLGVVKELGKASDPIPSVALSSMVFETTVRDLLLVRQYRCELWTRSKSSGFKLSRKASPGNLHQFEDYIFRNADVNTSSTIMAMKISGSTVGVAYCDVASNKIAVCEFEDNDQFTTFESIMVQIGAKECLYDEKLSGADGKKLMQIAERSGMLNTPRKRRTFDTKDLIQDLDRLLKMPAGTSAAALPEVDMKLAMGAVCSLIGYLELVDNETSFGCFILSRFDGSEYMRLDTAAAQAMNLFPSAMDGGNKTMSIYGVLDQCKTAQGKRLLAQWIKQPLLDEARINERLNLVETFYTSSEMRDNVREEVLRKMPDLNRLAKKFTRQKAKLQDVVRMYQVIELLPLLHSLLDEYDEDHSPLLKQLFAVPIDESISEFAKFKQLVEATINLRETENHEYLIREDYSPRLKEIKDQMEEAQEQVPALGEQAANELKLEFGKAVKLENDSRNGYYLRITRQNDKILRTKGKRFITIETQKNGVKFTNRELQAVNEQYESLKAEYEEEQSTVVAEVLKIAGGYSVAMDTLSDILAALDVLQSMAHVSMHAPIPFVRPVIKSKGSGVLKLEESRHPCVELQDDVSFIPNDVNLIKGKSQFNIITGPNMGGKSTYIRQIGVNVLLAQIGCFVPCSSAEISIVDSILARVGAGDSQLKGVSTFMAEMLETASILKSATPDSLIIVDELGRGTSTYDGFGLAWAISEYIVSKLGSFCLFATHFHELTRLENDHPGVSNLHVTAHTSTDSLTLLYQVKPGICDQSFGINVAELANFPVSVVEHAKRKAAELEDFSTTGEEDTGKRQKVEEVIKTFVQKANEIPADATPEKRVQELRSIKANLGDMIAKAGLTC